VHRQDYEMARVEKTVKILICNAGSSRLKFSHFEALMVEGGIDWTTEPTLLLRCRRQWEIRADRELPNLSFPALELDQKTNPASRMSILPRQTRRHGSSSSACARIQRSYARRRKICFVDEPAAGHRTIPAS
jgi:hypothetical protein